VSLVLVAVRPMGGCARLDALVRKTIILEEIDPGVVFGANDANLRLIEKHFDAKIVARGSRITIEGAESEVDRASAVFVELVSAVRSGLIPRTEETDMAIRRVRENLELVPAPGDLPILHVSNKKERVRPKTAGQRQYVQTMAEYDVVFSIGPAGTGKTYLAVAMAVNALKQKAVTRIILARPAVEAGESLGFLPGDLREKVDPYLKPLYDALYDMLPASQIRKYLDTGVIEIAPMAYMRGRTLNNSFVILDEAQNSTIPQMKMFLTRLGVNSKAVVTGDITQVDLSDKTASGLIQVQTILKDIDGIKFVYLTEKDVVRHRLVQDIIRAYELHEKKDK
jgi:phosphate starvation-inducible PhoH-like protein